MNWYFVRQDGPTIEKRWETEESKVAFLLRTGWELIDREEFDFYCQRERDRRAGFDITDDNE